MNDRPIPEGYREWREYVRIIHEAYARRSSLAVVAGSVDAAPRDQGPTLLLFSPHPDDETLTGALAIRARRELSARVVNYAVTLGSDVAEKPRRLRELQAACEVLEFELVLTGASGLDEVKPVTRRTAPRQWEKSVAHARQVLEEVRPDVVVFPHQDDWHPTHCGTSLLATEALDAYADGGGIASSAESARGLLAIETEYWRPMPTPNLLLGLSLDDESLLLTALTRHVKEVARNPYHLSHPARLMDNVRRGTEVVFGEGAPARGFLFGELYRVREYRGKAWKATRIGPDEILSLTR